MSLNLLPSAEYSLLAFQTAGILIAIALLSRLIGKGPRDWVLRSAAVGTALAIACLTMLPELDSRVRRFNNVRNATAGVTPAEARTRCIVDAGLTERAAFFGWAQRRMTPEDRWWDASGMSITPPCKMYALLPALPAANPQDADWTLFAGGVPPELVGVVEEGGPGVFRFGQQAGLVRRAP